MGRPLGVGSVVCAVALVVLVLPAVATAHAGRSAPVATDFEATIRGIAPETSLVRTKVVDGDLELWLRADPSAVVEVAGIQGEPLLLFDRRGVFINVRSLTAAADRIDPRVLQPVAGSRASPIWHRVTTGHSFMWHEHRLHALQPLAHGRNSSGILGRWSVPLRVDGARGTITGVLAYAAPDAVWLWVGLACTMALAMGGAFVPWQSSATRRAAACAAVAATLLVCVIRIGRELYGRPGVHALGYAEIAATCAVGIALLYALGRWRGEGLVVLALFVSVGSLYEALTMLPVLTHAVALSALPSTFVRVAAVAMLGLGGGLLALVLRAPASALRSHSAGDHGPEPVGGAA